MISLGTPPEADSGIWSTSGRYASYWNAFLFLLSFQYCSRKYNLAELAVIMRKEREVYSVSCIGMLPFIEGSLGDGTSGLVAVSHDSEERA